MRQEEFKKGWDMMNQPDPREYLLNHTSLEHFCILKTAAIQPGLIHYRDLDDEISVLMDDDDDRVERCIQYLKQVGQPVFASEVEVDRFLTDFDVEQRNGP